MLPVMISNSVLHSYYFVLFLEAKNIRIYIRINQLLTLTAQPLSVLCQLSGIVLYYLCDSSVLPKWQGKTSMGGSFCAQVGCQLPGI
jgi:hypothetical protein